jgi:hypothetical protein
MINDLIDKQIYMTDIYLFKYLKKMIPRKQKQQSWMKIVDSVRMSLYIMVQHPSRRLAPV